MENDNRGNKGVHVHFPWTLLTAVVMFAGTIVFLYNTFGRYDARDEAAYQELVYGDSSKVPETTRSVQNRTGLQKDVFYQNNGQDLQLSLNSATAELVLLKRDGATEFVENMHDVGCWLQEKVVHPEDPKKSEQIIVNLQAKSASYRYKDQFFAADSVNVKRYMVPGHELVKDLKDPMVALDADHIESNGKEIDFSGNVHVVNDLGDVTADHMLLESQGGFDGNHLDTLNMDGNVRLDLGEGGVITCHRATLDSKGNVGHFLSGPTHEFVEYIEKSPIVVRSRKMEVRLFEEGKKSKMHIASILADGEVSVSNQEGIVATSDHAVFCRNTNVNNGLALQGTITMLPDAPGGLCKVTNAAGDHIFATQINMDTNTRNLVFNDPKGTLSYSDKPEEKVEFSSKKLVWNNREEFLVLSGKASILQKGVGQLNAVNNVVVTLRNVDGKKMVHTIGSNSDVVLVHTDPELGLSHTLKSYGSFKIDHEKMESRLLSPKDEEGNVLDGKQVFFEDSKGDIYADRAFVKYEYVDKVLVPVRVVLEGNVRITNRLAFSEKDQTPVKQYVLADRVDFLPRTKEMILKSTKGERVLLFDQANDLQVSAPAIKLVRDQATKKESVQGLGDVRLRFAENEFQRIRRLFAFEKEGNKR